MTSFLSVMGINPRSGSIGPAGNHLRWSFPAALGLPEEGFLVFRRKSVKLPPKEIKAGAWWRSSSSQHGLTAVAFGPRDVQTRIIAAKPLTHVMVELSEVTADVDVDVRAFSGARLVEVKQINRSAADAGAEFRFAGITHLEIDAPLARLGRMQAVLMEDDLRTGWDSHPVARLPVLMRGQEGEALARLEDDLRNHHAQTSDEAKNRFRDSVSDLLELHEQILSGREFEVIAGPGDSTTRAALNPVAALLLAAQNPILARMAALYWVDVGTDVHDYKIQARWKRHGMREGLVLNVGAEQAGLPALPAATEMEMSRLCWQLPGMTWPGGAAHGRMALRWPLPPTPRKAVDHAVQPVLFEVRRGDVLLTQDHLACVVGTAVKDSARPFFTDPAAPVGVHKYKVRGIDLFGQTGNEINLHAKVGDDLPPPPPVRLSAGANAEQTELSGQFEYGPAQRTQVPEVESFQLMTRAGSLAQREKVRVTVLGSVEVVDGAFQHDIRVTRRDGGNLDATNFDGGVLEMPRQTPPQTVSAARRFSWRVVNVLGTDKLRVVSARDASPAGDRDLVADPHHRGHWQALGDPIPATAPLHGRLEANAAIDLRLKIVSAPVIVPRRADDASTELEEFEVDQHFVDPSPWLGGKVWKGSVEVIIHAIAPPAAAGRGSRLRIGAGWGFQNGDILALTPDANVSAPPLLCELRITPDGSPSASWLPHRGGEIGVVTSESSVIPLRPVTVARIDGAALRVWVRAAPGAYAHLRRGVGISYAPPYEWKHTLSLAAGAAADIFVPIPEDRGTENLYLVVCARRGNTAQTTGPLSAPVAVTLIRTAPAAAPSAPYPFGAQDDAEGFATPPDAEGRSTIHIQWDAPAVPDAAHLKYEVARALDSAIPAAHHRNWLRGIARDDDNLIVAGDEHAGTISDLGVDDSGIYHVRFDPDDPPRAGVDFRGGRISQGAQWFEVTFAGTDGASIVLLLRAVTAGAPVRGRAVLKAKPGYEGIQTDTAALQQIAEENSEVFALVAATPVAAVSFLDEIPGRGSARVFYRARAIDVAGNASAWSAVSQPFHQADATPPTAPTALRAASADREIVLTWDVPETSVQISRYALVWSQTDAIGVRSEIEIASADLVPAALRIANGSLTLPASCVTVLPGVLSKAQAPEQMVRRVSVKVVAGPNANTELASPGNVTAQVKIVATDATTTTVQLERLSGFGSASEGVAVQVSLRRADGSFEASWSQDPVRWQWTQRVDDDAGEFEFALSAIKTVRTAAPTGAGFVEMLLPGRAATAMAVLRVQIPPPPDNP